eukprot:TRINITY_DN7655_c0_g1_i5.p1 TRINITY_DN7655_c0_g1~~TRINITY_DN7655_c0_g1_i5.p1  ORF type:complete len:1057 (-),score=191.91 TRINITY_DN7655_c0_g1_i5:214-3384(-)
MHMEVNLYHLSIICCPLVYCEKLSAQLDHFYHLQSQEARQFHQIVFWLFRPSLFLQVGMAEAILSPLVEMMMKKLASLAQDQVTSAWGIDKELEKLSDTLSTIQAVLKEAENKQEKEKSEAVGIWLRKLKEVAFDADDVLDEFATKALRRRIQTSKRKKVRKFLTCSPCNAVLFRLKMSNKVKEIWERLDLIAKDRHNLHLTHGDVDGGMQHESKERRETSSLVEEACVVGRGEVRRELTEFLVSNEVRGRNLSVISIVGMGGMGKTTLAQLVYNDEIVKREFDLKMWICVSQDFAVKKLTKAMINSATSSRSYNLEEQDLIIFVNELDLLQTKLKDILSEKRFLLVLDDVWNEEQSKWDSLRVPLTGGAEGSIVLVTTRSEAVSRLMRTICTHRLEGLSESDCWSLFKQRAFGEESLEAHSRLAEIGREVVKKCQGLPLAAKTLGGILAFKRDERDWKNILESELWDLPKNSDEILPVLKLSYNHLPSHLKQCFAYCSLFPKHYEFKKIELIHLWIGEGFIQPEGRKQLEDIGLEYFDDLLLTSFFQYSQQNDREPIYKMHNMIHDLAQSISDGVCFRMDRHQLSDISRKARHFSVTRTHSKPIVFESIFKSSTLRTFLLPDGFNRGINSIPPDLFLHLRCLRVLDLSNTAIKKLPDSVGNLKHLRYLNLSSTDIKRLPNSVSTLYSLQTLKLNRCHQLLHLPKYMKNLINLHHLSLNESYMLVTMPVRMGKLTSLQTLTKFIVGKKTGYGIEELKDMINLRGEIRILNLENVVKVEAARQANLKNKQLQKMGLEWSVSRDQNLRHDERGEEGILEGLQPHTSLKQLYIENYNGVSFPSWMSDSSLLSNLTSLSLQGCRRCKFLPSLGKLPLLKHLVIDSFSELVCVGHEFCGDGSIKGFPALEVLYFTSMENVEEWSDVREGEFPSLRKLVLLDWPKLKRLPNGLQNLTSLKQLLIMGFHQLLLLPGHGLPLSLESLEITFCHSLTSLPMGMQNLTSLQRLEIRSCSKLASLPDDGLPNELQNLWISGCPSLEGRCKNGGEEWLKIAHIPTVNM